MTVLENFIKRPHLIRSDYADLDWVAVHVMANLIVDGHGRVALSSTERAWVVSGESRWSDFVGGKLDRLLRDSLPCKPYLPGDVTVPIRGEIIASALSKSCVMTNFVEYFDAGGLVDPSDIDTDISTLFEEARESGLPIALGFLKEDRFGKISASA